jgi:CRP-like cAMP-binding protein
MLLPLSEVRNHTQLCADLGEQVTWVTIEPDGQLIETGKPLEAISLIVRGKVCVTNKGRVLGNLTPGNFVGSALLLSGIPAEVDARAIEPVRAVRWKIKTLERYLSSNLETRTMMQKHLALDLSSKLVSLASGS